MDSDSVCFYHAFSSGLSLLCNILFSGNVFIPFPKSPPLTCVLYRREAFRWENRTIIGALSLQSTAIGPLWTYGLCPRSRSKIHLFVFPRCVRNLSSSCRYSALSPSPSSPLDSLSPPRSVAVLSVFFTPSSLGTRSGRERKRGKGRQTCSFVEFCCRRAAWCSTVAVKSKDSASIYSTSKFGLSP